MELLDNDTIEGIVEAIIYQNDDNGWTVFSIILSEEVGDELVCTGNMEGLFEGEEVSLTGRYAIHPSYGEQFQVDYWEKKLPTEETDMQKYLASGIIKGIGPKLSKRIVDKFKDTTFIVIEEQPERLAEVHGISLNKAIEIGEIFMEQREERQVMLFFQQYNVSPRMAKRIFDEFGADTISIVKENPYILAKKIRGIGFKTADTMALEIGIDSHSPFRIQAGIEYVLEEGKKQGHIYLPKDQLLRDCQIQLSIELTEVEHILIQMQMEGDLYQEAVEPELKDKAPIYLKSQHQKELGAARRLVELSMTEFDPFDDIDAIHEIEQEMEIDLDDLQKDVLIKGLSCGVLIVTGGPGTGKTTTIAALIRLIEQRDETILMAAPTGRAAKRMEETTGKSASTIHRLLDVNFTDDEVGFFNKSEEEPLDADVIIIDESSMLDSDLLYHLLSAIEIGTRIIFIGDRDQLPSVGAGNVLADMIDSECIPLVRLTKVFRQSNESHIVTNAHLINNGEFPVFDNESKDFFFINKHDAAENVAEIKTLIKTRLPSFLNCHPHDIQILTPTRRGPLGVDELNKEIQEALNPPKDNKAEMEYRQTVFREGDKVIQIKNNYNLEWETKPRNMAEIAIEGKGIFNGDEGVIQYVDTDADTVTVVFDDKYVTYEYNMLDELELSYALTVHKSQGSEYKAVIMPMHPGPYLLMTRNLLYTGITRSRDLCCLVGRQKVLAQMIQTARQTKRFTNLKNKIREMHDLYGTT